MKKRFLYSLPVAIIVAVIAFNQFSCKKENDNGSLLGNSRESPLKTDGAAEKAFRVQETFSKIFEMYEESVVFITTEQYVKVRPHPFFDDPVIREFFGDPGPRQERKHKRTGLGSGFIISKDGYVCTNHHLIAGVDSVSINIGDKNYDAEIIGSDEYSDIALLKIDSNDSFKPVYLGDSDEIKTGDWAIAIGNPFGLDKTFTVGVVSATAREDVDFMGESFIQTDASINPGNSGGPLINIFGEVIGINRMIYSKTGGDMGIGFAIPINSSRKILEQLKEHREVKRGYIGVSLSAEYNLMDKSNKGAYVQDVLSGSPASAAGLQQGDIIKAVNNTEVENFRELIHEVSQKPIGSRIQVRVLRGNEELNLFVVVSERPQ